MFSLLMFKLAKLSLLKNHFENWNQIQLEKNQKLMFVYAHSYEFLFDRILSKFIIFNKFRQNSFL